MSSNIDSEQLISLVEARPALWDKSIGLFKDKQKRIECWREICLTFNDDFDKLQEKQRIEYGKLIQAKWTAIRNAWLKRVKIQKAEKASGSGAKTSRPYIYEKQLSFLKKIYTESPNVVDSIVSVVDDTSLIESDSIDEPEEIEPTENVTRKRRVVPVRSEVDTKMLKFLDQQMLAPKMETKEENHHVAFIKSLLPSLNKLDEDQTLQFQSGVINLLQKVKQNKTNIYSSPHHEQYIPTPISSNPSPYSNHSDLSFLDL